MFQKILIANRGEISFRVIYKKMEIKKVWVYPIATKEILHLRWKDETVYISATAIKDSCLYFQEQ